MKDEIEPLMINYKHLEPRPHRWRKQLYIKGRNMTVWQLVSNMLTECYLPTEVAENYGLPLETIAEALLYCIDNWELIQAEREEEWEWLKANVTKNSSISTRKCLLTSDWLLVSE